jgi:hypothetical protein
VDLVDGVAELAECGVESAGEVTTVRGVGSAGGIDVRDQPIGGLDDRLAGCLLFVARVALFRLAVRELQVQTLKRQERPFGGVVVALQAAAQRCRPAVGRDGALGDAGVTATTTGRHARRQSGQHSAEAPQV